MKKKMSILLVIVLVLSSIFWTACGGEEDEPIPPPEDVEPGPSPHGVAPTGPDDTPAPSSSHWNDIPIYSNAKQVQKGSWSIPPAEGDFLKVEWRYYEVGDEMDNVVDFYRSNMPEQGWTEMGWLETPGVSWGMFSKNDEQDAAMVWISTDDGKTIVAIMRGTE